MERRLYEASLSGCVATLNELIEEDQLILDRNSATHFHETPLHVVALRGHLDFTRALLSQKPKLAAELDLQKRSPLHLASIEGYIDIVRELLHANLDMCGVRDEDGRLPLHLAVMKGRIEVMKELIRARPESTRETLAHGSHTVLHLSVQYNHLEALKFFVEIVSDDVFLNSKDDNGNTILHVAAILKQMETIKYLLSRTGVEGNKNAINKNGFTALDVLEHCPRDLKGMEILYFLREAGVRRASELTSLPPPPPPSKENVVVHHHKELVPLRILSKVDIWMKYLSHQGDKWYEETQDTLMLVATVFASITFQSALNPPGGVWQQDSGADMNPACGKYNTCEAGNSVLAYIYPYWFQLFAAYNTVSLVASLSIILLIISGFPLKNKICMWLLTLIMCITVTSIGLSYLVAMNMVTPDPVLERGTHWIYEITLYVWFGLLGVVGLILVARFLYWLVKKLRKFIRRMRSSPANESQLLA